MSENEKKVLESFLDKIKMPGICGFFIPEDSDSVMIVMDLSWIKSVQVNPTHLAVGMRKRLKEKIKDYLNMNVYVGSTVVESCQGS